jgi:hypothetical protein
MIYNVYHMKKFTGFRLSPTEKEMLDDIKSLHGERLSYTQIVVMGISSLYKLAQEVRKQTQDPNERIGLFEWVRTTRDVVSAEETESSLETLRNIRKNAVKQWKWRQKLFKDSLKTKEGREEHKSQQ